jgi:chromosome partitioning protein
MVSDSVASPLVSIYVNLKGGVTKTTTVINAAIATFLLGKRVLVVDLDIQGNTTTALGYVPGRLEHTVYTFMCGKSTFESTIKHTHFDKVSKRFIDPTDSHLLESSRIKEKNIIAGPDLLPCNIKAAVAENELISNPQWGSLLRNALSGVRSRYDYIFIDTHPDLGKLTVNGFITADCVIIPTVPEPWPTDGLITLSSSIAEAQQVNPGLQVGGLLFAKVKYADHGKLIDYIQQSLVPDINASYPTLHLACFQSIINESALFLKSTNSRSCVVLSHPTEAVSLSYWGFLMEILQKSGRSSDFALARDQLQQLHAVYKAREDEKARAKQQVGVKGHGKEN